MLSNEFKPKLYPILKNFHDAEERHNRWRCKYTADPEWQEARQEYLALSISEKYAFTQLADLMRFTGIYSEIIEMCR